MVCTETQEKYSGGDIQCCGLKQERNRACLENEIKINPGKCKEVSFTKARAKELIRYYFGVQLMAEVIIFKFLGIIIRTHRNWQVLSIAHCRIHGKYLIS